MCVLFGFCLGFVSVLCDFGLWLEALVGDTSSVSTTATAGTTSLTSASSAEKKVEKRKKQNDE